MPARARGRDACLRRSSPALAAQQDAQRIARELPRLPKAVVQEPHVVLLDEVGMIAEDGDGGRRYAHLLRVVELHLPTRGLRRLASTQQIHERCVEATRA